VPLTPAGRNEGTLSVVPGTHRQAPPDRGSGAESFVAVDEGWPAAALPIEVPVGTAICFHPGLIHGSGPNLGAASRLAVISTFQPFDAPMLHYERRPHGDVVYRVGRDFYISNYRPGDRAPGHIA
jgi:ectoine hydroxylase-related dioxygenase (phytanoyl-CoA dioxygenase family)